MPFLQIPRRADYDVYVWKPGAADTWPVDYPCGGVLAGSAFRIWHSIGGSKTSFEEGGFEWTKGSSFLVVGSCGMS